MSKSKKSRKQHLPGELTLLLTNTKNPERLNDVLSLTYPEIRFMARCRLRGERTGHSWQPTVLANEACIRLIESSTDFQNRRHFFGAVSRAMREALLDHIRKFNAIRRGRYWKRVDFELADQIGFEHPANLLDFEVLLNHLEKANPKLSQIVEFRVYWGFSFREIADILGIAESTARSRCTDAKRWFRTALANSSQ